MLRGLYCLDITKFMDSIEGKFNEDQKICFEQIVATREIISLVLSDDYNKTIQDYKNNRIAYLSEIFGDYMKSIQSYQIWFQFFENSLQVVDIVNGCQRYALDGCDFVYIVVIPNSDDPWYSIYCSEIQIPKFVNCNIYKISASRVSSMYQFNNNLELDHKYYYNIERANREISPYQRYVFYMSLMDYEEIIIRDGERQSTIWMPNALNKSAHDFENSVIYEEMVKMPWPIYWENTDGGIVIC